MDGPASRLRGRPAIAAVASARLTSDGLVILGILLVASSRSSSWTWDKRAARRAKAAALAAQPAPQWAISLLVDADEKSGILRPIVQLLGPQLPSDITVDLHVGDERGDVRLTTERRFSDPATRTDLVLGTLAVPDGVSVAEAALCDWTVVVSHDGHEIARRRGPLAAAPRLNDEAELQAPDLEPEPDVEPPPPATPDPVRHLRWTIGLSCSVCGCAIGGYLLTTLSAWLWFVAVPLFLLAAILLVAAALVLHTPCPLCGRLTTVVGRTGAQRCDACARFTLTPVWVRWLPFDDLPAPACLG